MTRKKGVFRRSVTAAMIVLLLVSLLAAPAGAANSAGLVVEKLNFRDVLRLYSVDRGSFGYEALKTDEQGVANASKRLAELFAFTVGLNYAGQGANSNYFGKDITAQMDVEPYVPGNLLATYPVEIQPYRSYALALPEGKTTSIRVYLVGYTNAANGVEPVLHYVWQENGSWWAVKDDNPFYRVSYNGQSARTSAGGVLVQSRSASGGGTESWTDLSDAPDGEGVVHLSDSTLVAGQGSANVFGVTSDLNTLNQTGGLASCLTAVSDYVRGDTTFATGPLVFARECYEEGTMHKVPDGEALKAGTTYRFRVVYDEALTPSPGTAWKDVGIDLRSEVTGETKSISDFTWYGSSDYLTSDRYNPHTVEFTFTPQQEGNGVCTFVLNNLVGSESALKAADFHTCTATGSVAAVAAALSAPAENTPALATPAPAARPLAETRATALPVLTSAGENTPVTRSMLAESLWTLSGAPAADHGAAFQDMPASDRARQAVEWAAAAGLIVPNGDTFGSEQAVTREQMSVVLRRYAALRGLDVSAGTDLSGWSDSAMISSWASESMSWAVASGVLTSSGASRLAPRENALCSDAIGMIFRLEQLL